MTRILLICTTWLALSSSLAYGQAVCDGMAEHRRVNDKVGWVGRAADEPREDVSHHLVGGKGYAGDSKRLVYHRHCPVRAAESPNLALSVNVLERRNDFGHRGSRIALVEEVEINLIDAEALEAEIDIRAD